MWPIHIQELIKMKITQLKWSITFNLQFELNNNEDGTIIFKHTYIQTSLVKCNWQVDCIFWQGSCKSWNQSSYPTTKWFDSITQGSYKPHWERKMALEKKVHVTSNVFYSYMLPFTLTLQKNEK